MVGLAIQRLLKKWVESWSGFWWNCIDSYHGHKGREVTTQVPHVIHMIWQPGGEPAIREWGLADSWLGVLVMSGSNWCMDLLSWFSKGEKRVQKLVVLWLDSSVLNVSSTIWMVILIWKIFCLLFCSFFSHYAVNRRLDEWVKLDQLDLDSVETDVDEKVEDKVILISIFS